MEFKSAIVDELGFVVEWCDRLSEKEIQDVLTDHPEWSRKCIQIG